MIPPNTDIRDLRLFADPATDFRAQESSDSARVQMIRDGAHRDYVIDQTSGRVTARHAGGRLHANVTALLASEEFADIRSLRATQRRVLQTKIVEHYIPPEGQLDRSGTSSDLDMDVFAAAANTRSHDLLSILLLDGPAGIGKTSLIERIVYERTDPAALQPPILHVTSSGGRLTDLPKALAHASQLLRSRVFFDQVPILVRRGILQVAIDGFDELVDPNGYKDAWFALREFLREVSCGGPIILAGRDTFFDQQSFQKRLAERIKNLDLASARLHPVSPRAARTYLRSRGWSDLDLDSAEEQEWLKPGSYQLRPFFLAQIGGANSWLDLQTAHRSPQAFLVTRFVRREAEIVSRMVALEIESAETALWDFYGMIVEDMAAQEIDEVDDGFLALACEAAFSAHVAGDDLAKLMHKAGSFGLLETEGRLALRRFPHTEIENQFLARSIVRNLESSAAIASFMRRGTINMALSEAFADTFNALDPVRAKTILSKLQRLSAEEAFADRLANNVVALLLAALTRAGLGDTLTLRSQTCNEARVFGVLAAAILDEVSLTRLDARGADLRDVEFINCSVAILTVDSATQFGTTFPAISTGLQLETAGAIVTVRDPAGIEKWFLDHSIGVSITPSTADAELPLVKYFDRVCRKFIRQHQIRNSVSDEAFFLLQDPMWPEVHRLLGGRLAAEIKTAGGPRDVFYRLVRPDALLQPSKDDLESTHLRQAIITRARELS